MKRTATEQNTPAACLSQADRWISRAAGTTIAGLAGKVTGEQFSHTTIWKLRNGQAANPQMRLIEALARTFGVPPAFFFSDYDDEKAGLLREQVELLALVRDTGVTSAQLRAMLELSPGARQAVAALIEHTARTEARRNHPAQG
jgi:transcriptional regulator with XRE-family HTH domain